MVTTMEFYVAEKERKLCRKQVELVVGDGCVSVEQGIYDYTKQYCEVNRGCIDFALGIYKDTLRDILYNCNCAENKTMQGIVKKVKANKYNGYNLAFLRPEEKDRDAWDHIIKRKENIIDTIKNLATIKRSKCKICGCNEYNWWQLQTRSADEPITTFYCCINCNHVTKINN